MVFHQELIGHAIVRVENNEEDDGHDGVADNRGQEINGPQQLSAAKCLIQNDRQTSEIGSVRMSLPPA